MHGMSITELSAVELAKELKCGTVTGAEAVEAAVAQMNLHSVDNTFITEIIETARCRAYEFDCGTRESILAGVPFAVKDNICTNGVRTTCASKMLRDFVPPYDASVMTRLYEAGGILLGKLNMDEFAMGSTTETSFFGAVPNPWDRTRTAGGSSGGAAAAVANRECWYALASDTGGSIRQPAAYCGVTGMKPTYGTVSRYGLIAYASSFDQIGPIARTAEDCAAVLELIAGKDTRDSTSLAVAKRAYYHGLSNDIRGLRIGIPEECMGDGTDKSVRKAVMNCADVLREEGAVIELCSLPMMDQMIPAYYILAMAEASSNLSRYDGVKFGYRADSVSDIQDLFRKSRTEGFGEEVKRRIMMGSFVLSSGYYDAFYRKALQRKEEIAAAFSRLWKRFDLLLSPVTPSAAPKLGTAINDPLEMYLSDIFTVSANLAGLPAISFPCGTDESGLPIGAQLIGPRMQDQIVLNGAYAFQCETDYHKRSPEQEV